MNPSAQYAGKVGVQLHGVIALLQRRFVVATVRVYDGEVSRDN